MGGWAELTLVTGKIPGPGHEPVQEPILKWMWACVKEGSYFLVLSLVSTSTCNGRAWLFRGVGNDGR